VNTPDIRSTAQRIRDNLQSGRTYRTYAPPTEADAARADAVWDAAYAEAIAAGWSHPMASAIAADAATADAAERTPDRVRTYGREIIPTHVANRPEWERF
jgi:hypothetical protein